MLATSSLDVHIVQNVGKPKELRVLATIFSSVHPDKSLQTTAIVDCSAATMPLHSSTGCLFESMASKPIALRPLSLSEPLTEKSLKTPSHITVILQSRLTED
jgi:hypothetical protein